VPQVTSRASYFGNLTTNLKYFLARDFHMKSGMKYLVESFYRSITEGAEPPLSYREILFTATIMDAIFEQLSRQQNASLPGADVVAETRARRERGERRECGEIACPESSVSSPVCRVSAPRQSCSECSA